MELTRESGVNSAMLGCLLLIFSITAVSADVLEACSWEKLEAECPINQVILLKHARYGRLHIGKCVKQNFGFLGCVADVRTKIDPSCSGRQKCSLDVYQTLQNERPEACSELEAFLQIEFHCVPVVPLPRQQCADRILSVHEETGYLPSFYSHGEAVITGRSGCTVELVAHRGQVWNLTLWDFGESDTKTTSKKSDMGRQKESIWCTRYAVVKENVDATEKHSIVCGNTETQSRERSVYLSSTNIVTVDLNLEVQSTYLIAFKVVGCAVPDTPNLIHVKAEGDSHTFYCNTTGESWSLMCKGSHWEGHHKACGTVPKSSEFRTSRDWNSTTGLVIVVGLGLVLGIIIGSSLLGLVVCYYRRRYKRGPAVQQIYGGPTYGSSQQKDTGSLYKRYQPEPARHTQNIADYGTKSPNPTDTYKYPYQSCRPSVPYIANLPEPLVTSQIPPRAVTCGTPAHIQRPYMEEDMVMSQAGTGAGTHYGRSTSDTSSNSDHVYEIPS